MARERSLGSNYVMSISEDPEGYLWLGQWFFGLSRLDAATGLMRHFPLEDDRVYFVNAVEKGRVYAGTWGGGLFELETGYRYHGAPCAGRDACGPFPTIPSIHHWWTVSVRYG
jgi:hypothetical protein